MNSLNKDILLGTAIGDALGLPVQFLEREVVAKNPITTMAVSYTHLDKIVLVQCISPRLLLNFDTLLYNLHYLPCVQVRKKISYISYIL